MKLLQFFQIPETFDPDDYRMRRILNIIILFLMAAALVALIAVFSYGNSCSCIFSDPESLTILGGSIGIIVVGTILIALNRSSHIPKNVVGSILIASLLAVTFFSDTPKALTDGPSSNMLLLPIVLSAIVLPPASVFMIDIVVTILFMYAAEFQWVQFNVYALIIIWAVSAATWLGMSLANKALRDAHNEAKKNRAILDGVADGVVVFGVDNTIALANPAAEELLDGELTKILSASESAEICGRFLSLRWSTVQGVGRVAIVRDISRQIEIDRAKDAILGVVSHEMRTPLSVILGFSELLKVRPTPDMAERIRINALRMIRMVDNLLDLAQLQARALKMYQEKFPPRLLADEVDKLLCEYALEKQVALNITVAESLPDELTGDLQRYQQILVNLVDNAIKFTKKGGRVDILLAPHGEPEKWQMVVSDTGIGIPTERLPDIFEPFRRASDYATRSYQGAGLGLSIAKQIAQLARGDIEVKSTVGQGSTFTVTLPIKGGA